MSTTSNNLAAAVAKESAHELSEAHRKIVHCLNQLNDEQIWWRPAEAQNSIGNLILHLAGNIRQWIISGLGGAKDVRNRPLEFSERCVTGKAELSSQLKAVVDEAVGVLSKMDEAELLRVRRVQGTDVSGIGAIFRAVPHFRGHTQEIIYRTRCALGEKYVFDWTPSPAQQGKV